ncbi:hypothetical protein ACFLQY_01645 [Verrucomicrobiota bacterium]
MAITIAICGWGQVTGGFDLSNSKVDVGDIFSGGAPRDGIPALNQPEFIRAHRANYLSREDRMPGLTINGITIGRMPRPPLKN